MDQMFQACTMSALQCFISDVTLKDRSHEKNDIG